MTLKLGDKSSVIKVPAKTEIKTDCGIYDVARDGGEAGTYVIGTIPDNATVVKAWYEVLTTFTDGATDASTIALSTAKAANEIISAVAISDAGNPWDAGYHDGVPNGAAANFTTKTTAVTNVQAVVAVATLTAGKMKVWWQYIVSE